MYKTKTETHEIRPRLMLRFFHKKYNNTRVEQVKTKSVLRRLAQRPALDGTSKRAEPNNVYDYCTSIWGVKASQHKKATKNI